MTDAQAAKRQAADGAYASGIEMLDRGESPEGVEQKLVEIQLFRGWRMSLRSRP